MLHALGSFYLALLVFTGIFYGFLWLLGACARLFEKIAQTWRQAPRTRSNAPWSS